jgi:putative flippase GtrA
MAVHAVRALLDRREVRFLIVGGGNTVLGLALFAGFHALVPHYLVALVLTYAVGIVVAFVTQRLFVFGNAAPALPALARFTAVQLLVLALNAAVLTVLVEWVGAPVLLSQAIAVVVVVVSSYFGHLLFSFRHHHDKPVRPHPSRTPSWDFQGASWDFQGASWDFQGASRDFQAGLVPTSTTEEPKGRLPRRSSRRSARHRPISSFSTPAPTSGSEVSGSFLAGRSFRSARSAANIGSVPANM